MTTANYQTAGDLFDDCLHQRPLSLHELMGLSLDGILGLAAGAVRHSDADLDERPVRGRLARRRACC
ncbi:MAG TPA: hypothetical protein VMV69_01595 [Pirellulales bacterium]|nr:hypothetical protein [Pirellulales bacterium]